MIELTWVTAIMIYLCITLVVLFAVWGFTHRRDRNKKVELIPKMLFQCEYCGSIYLDEIAKKVTTCPDCQSLNKNNKYR